MKAVFIHEHGGPEVLQYDDLLTPEPDYGEVQIAIKAAAVNHLDIWVRKGWPGIRLDYPFVLGADGAGVVSEVGPGVRDFAVGDRIVINGTFGCGYCENCLAGRDNFCRAGTVLGESHPGVHAEVVVLPTRNVLKIPEHISFEEAAAASLVFLTAWHSLITRGRLLPGESVLVVGAGGGVNTAAIQIAKLTGATVYVIGSTDEKLEKAQALGADVLVNRHKEENWSKAIWQLTQRRGVDVVVDNVGQATWSSSLRALRRGGRMVVVGNTSGYDTAVDSRLIFGKHLSIIGSTMAPQADFRTAMKMVFEGKLHAVIDRAMSLSQIREAHTLLENGKTFGKIVLLTE